MTYSSDYYQSDKFSILEQKRNYRLLNLKLFHEREKQNRIKYKEKIKAYAKQYYLRNRLKMLDYQRRRYEKKKLENKTVCSKCLHEKSEHYEWADGEKGCRDLFCDCDGFKT